MDILLIVLEDGHFLEMQFAEKCSFHIDGCDAAIDYTLYDRFYEKEDSGRMGYMADKKNYGCIQDAAADMIKYVLRLHGGLVPTYYII